MTIMHNISIILILAFLFGCSSRQPKSSDDHSGERKISFTDSLRIENIRISDPSQYQFMLDTLDKGDFLSLRVAARAYKNCVVDSLTCDSLFTIYIDFIRNVADGFLENNADISNALSNSPSAQVVSPLKAKLASSGIELIPSGATYALVANSGYLLNAFADALSTSYREFLLLEARDMTNDISVGSMVNVPSDSLISRILGWENFIRLHPTFSAIGVAQELYAQSMGNFLVGTHHAGVFDRDSYLLNDSIKRSFETFIQRNEGSGSAEVVKDYLQLLESTGYTYTDKVDSFLLGRVYR